jgi:hypothetical protein
MGGRNATRIHGDDGLHGVADHFPSAGYALLTDT